MDTANKYNPDIHHRHSLRLKNYDYSKPGAYFVTVCAQNRTCMFGAIENGNLALNDAGRMAQRVWQELPAHYHGVEIDQFIVMPNHFHGIIVLVGAGPCACPDVDPFATDINKNDLKGQPQGVAPTISLSDIVHRFKSLTTARYRNGVKEYNWRIFPGRLWQRNYYEHIIRSEDSLNRIRGYIRCNPARWDEDIENPARWDEKKAKVYYKDIL